MARSTVASPDPLRLFRSLAPLPRAGQQPFASGEHVWLGQTGARQAVRALADEGLTLPEDLVERIPRRHGPHRFTYGELVALSGDFYETPEDLFEERPLRLPFLRRANDVDALRKVMGEEGEWIEARQQGTGTLAYPEASLRLAFAAKSYVELALRNVDHFGWHNLVAYCRHHAAALELAAAAQGREDEHWRRALVMSAFADHFLTDAFAAGHLRVPRAAICEWAGEQGWSEKLAGALSKLLHDQDGHVETAHGDAALAEGLPVRNAAGHRWRTYCDGQLLLFPGATKAPHARLPAAAVAASLREVVRAWKLGERPRGLFAATRLAPFPDPKAPGLAQKFQALPRARLKALVKHTAWYAKVPWLGPGLSARHVERLVAALPDLMGRLRDHVEADLTRLPQLQRRLPLAYRAAFQAVR